MSKPVTMHAGSLAFLISAFLTHQAHPDAAIKRLERVYGFAFGGVGFGLSTSEGELDYRAVLSGKDAAADFETIFQKANTQGKCYALVGLRQLKPQRFESLAAPLRASRVCVTVMRGCLISSGPMSQVVERIRSGIYSGPMTLEIIPSPEGAAAATPEPVQTSWQRLLAIFSVASSKPDPPPPPLSPPPPPPPFRRHAACENSVARLK